MPAKEMRTPVACDATSAVLLTYSPNRVAASTRSRSLTISYLSKMLRVLWPLIAMQTFSDVPLRTILCTALRLQSSIFISQQRVACAFSIEISRPLGGIEIEAGVKDIFRLAPSYRVHRSDLTQFAEEPGASYGPFALDGSRRDSHGVGGFFDGQSREESELNDTALLVVDFGEISECVVEPD